MNKIRSLSRRAALGRLGIAGAAAALGSSVAPAALPGADSKTAAAGERAEVLALVGDRFHSFDYIRTALTRTLVTEGGVKVDFTPDPEMITAEKLRAYRLLIILCDGMTFPGGYGGPFSFMDQVKVVSDPPLPPLDETPAMWITLNKGRAIRLFVERGGSAWFFHNASYISGTNADFRHVEGALFTGHTPFRPYKMKIVNRDHPITQGVNDFVITEEQHYVVFDKDPKAVLVRSVNEEGLEFKTEKYGNQGATCEACWAYEYGKGRVCFMAPGHTIPSFWNPEYVKLQKNALKWLLRV